MNRTKPTEHDEQKGLRNTLAGSVVRISCALHLVTGWIAAILAVVEVETIVGTFPSVLLLSVPLQIAAHRRASWPLFYYGQSGTWMVAGVSLVIAAFDLSPDRAVPSVPILIVLYAIGLSLWCYLTNAAKLEHLPEDEGRYALFRFSLKSALVLSTVVCVLAAISRSIPWHSEMAVFGTGAFALVGISGFITYRYMQRRNHLSDNSEFGTEEPRA